MKREFIIGLMLTLGSASTIAICSADTGSMQYVTELRLEGTNWLYTGEMKCGEPNGHGEYLDVDSGMLVFEGKFVSGKPYGAGTSYQSDGSIRKGEWVDGQLIQGTEYDIDNQKTYTGGWILDEAHDLSVHHGVGIQYWENGNEKLNGTWDHGRFIEGKQFSKTGTLLYDGTWGFDTVNQMDVPNGMGTKYYYPEGTYYTGGWLFGKRHGIGSLFWSDGSEWIFGDWSNDLPNGWITEYYRGKKTMKFSGYVINGRVDPRRPYIENWISGTISHLHSPNSKTGEVEDHYYRDDRIVREISKDLWDRCTRRRK